MMNLDKQDIQNDKDQSFKPVNSPFSYFGSKNRISTKILSFFPPHYAWVEAFCGSASITFAKSPSKIEIINDIDDQIVNFFEQLRNNKEALLEAIEFTPYSLTEFRLSKSNQENLTPLEKARRFIVRAMMTVNGAYGKSSAGFSFSQSYSRNNTEARVNRWNNLPERLLPIYERLKTIRIENRDARELLKMFVNRPATLVYLDPPYLTKRSHAYNHDVNYEEYHRELLEICLKGKCMIVLSGYQSELYDNILTARRGWKKTIIKAKTRGTKGEDNIREEIIWQNKYALKGLRDGKVPIKLSKEEIINSKYNPVR
jgi:DNA adenine methylase